MVGLAGSLAVGFGKNIAASGFDVSRAGLVQSGTGALLGAVSSAMPWVGAGVALVGQFAKHGDEPGGLSKRMMRKGGLSPAQGVQLSSEIRRHGLSPRILLGLSVPPEMKRYVPATQQLGEIFADRLWSRRYRQESLRARMPVRIAQFDAQREQRRARFSARAAAFKTRPRGVRKTRGFFGRLGSVRLR